MKKIAFLSLICIYGLSADLTKLPTDQPQPDAYAAVAALKPRQPNWRTEIMKAYPNGNLETVVLYEPEIAGGEHPVKQVIFYENGRIKNEIDLGVVEEDSPSIKEWGSRFIPHGARIDLSPEGNLVQLIQYKLGVMEGERRTFYPNGKVGFKGSYSSGKLDGAAQSFFENGKSFLKLDVCTYICIVNEIRASNTEYKI